MLSTLGRVAREVREGSGLKQIDVAAAAGVSHVVISNLENGRRYPAKLDEVIAAYEQECGLPTNDLWRYAAERI